MDYYDRNRKRYEKQREAIAQRIAARTGEDLQEVIERANDLDRNSGWRLGTLDALRAIEREEF